jgi:putative ATPase
MIKDYPEVSMDLFDHNKGSVSHRETPLADRMRPQRWEDFLGQDHLVGPNSLLRKAVEAQKPFSMILWGPPGTGKTTLARLAAKETQFRLVSFSAVLSGVKEVRQILDEARKIRIIQGTRTILFVDELHRFNKAQQDAFLPHVEKGDILFFGATTENPSFEINSALLSRCHVFLLHPLGKEEILLILGRSLEDEEHGLGNLGVTLDKGVLESLACSVGGDARVAINIMESMVLATEPDSHGKRHLTLEEVRRILHERPLLYDKAGEEHFNLISALHKSLRGGDPDAALYWLARMLEAGEDPLYVARRMVRFASEDVGLADPQALQVALAAKDAFHFLGPPEGFLALAEAAIYLALAPKSNTLYKAYTKVNEKIKNTGSLPVPLALRNAPTGLMQQLGYGRDYRYPHDDPDRVVDQDYLPKGLLHTHFYDPSDQGWERELMKRLRHWRSLRRSKRGEDPS